MTGHIYGALRHHMASIFSDQVHPTGIRSLPAAASQLPHPQRDPGGNPRSAVAGTFSLQTVSRKSQGENSGIPEILFSSSVQSSWIPAQLSLRDLSKKDVRFERGRSWLVNHGGYLYFHPLWFTYLKRANWKTVATWWHCVTGCTCIPLLAKATSFHSRILLKSSWTLRNLLPFWLSSATFLLQRSIPQFGSSPIAAGASPCALR